MIARDSGWELLTAVGINDKGEIAGTGVIRDELHAFLLRPRKAGAGDTNVGTARTLVRRPLFETTWRDVPVVRRLRSVWCPRHLGRGYFGITTPAWSSCRIGSADEVGK